MATKYRPVTHVIFDMDGLLLDTELHYTRANEIICQRYDRQFTWELKQMQMGRRSQEAAQLLIDYLKLPITLDEYLLETRNILYELFPTAKLLPGAERLVRHLHDQKIPLAICTGSHEKAYDLKTKSHTDLFKIFTDHVLWTADDPEVKIGKPDPQCFQICSSRFFGKEIKPEQVLVFEDAPNGVEAALAAGMQVVMIPDERVSVETRSKATLTFKSLIEFKPELFGLPAMKDETTGGS